MTNNSGYFEALHIINAILCVGAIGALALAYFAHRKGSGREPHKGLLALALLILPGITLAFSDKVLLDGMKRDEFCASCHTMEPFFEALNDPENEGLSSTHARHARIQEKHCATCHTDYDLLGGVRAKAKGLLHLYAFYIKKDNNRPKLYDPYPNGNCYSCHGKGMTFFEVEDHQDNLEDLKSDEVSCLDCHGPAHDLEDYYDNDTDDDDTDDEGATDEDSAEGSRDDGDNDEDNDEKDDDG